MKCIVPGCKKEARCRGNCHAHEQAHRRACQAAVEATGCTPAEADQMLVEQGKWFPARRRGPRKETYFEDVTETLVAAMKEWMEVRRDKFGTKNRKKSRKSRRRTAA